MNKKELIRKHAIEVIAEEGFYNTKMQVIAEKAGIAVGTIYNYFRDKPVKVEQAWNMKSVTQTDI